ncbi:MAG: hypothetical protein HFJ55_01070 [Clostridia bacterium]|jgi:hypothetical protein|nr:hypothetical protein [Clostridia bacterium]
MRNLPKEIKLTQHAKQRLNERKDSDKYSNYYNIKNLMRSSCKWYGKDDLIQQSRFIFTLFICM